jgi:hypothetical protein
VTPAELQAAKPWWKSRTIWLNLLVLLLAAAETQLHMLQPLLPVNVYALVAFCLPLVNLAMRAVTQQAISVSGAKPDTAEPKP